MSPAAYQLANCPQKKLRCIIEVLVLGFCSLLFIIILWELNFIRANFEHLINHYRNIYFVLVYLLLHSMIRKMFVLSLVKYNQSFLTKLRLRSDNNCLHNANNVHILSARSFRFSQ